LNSLIYNINLFGEIEAWFGIGRCYYRSSQSAGLNTKLKSLEFFCLSEVSSNLIFYSSIMGTSYLINFSNKIPILCEQKVLKGEVLLYIRETVVNILCEKKFKVLS
jgi:hypothetical protein